ncbi:hypothetical protein Tco_1022124, partial [Tanacetum coccineum]
VTGEWFKKNCIGSVTTWEELVKKFIKKFYQLSYDNEEIEAEEDDDPDDITDIFKIEGNLFDYETPLTYEEYELNNTVIRDLEEPWLDNGVPYQLCDHICETYHFKKGMTKWPTCSSDIDGFCNSGELPGMVQGPYANAKTERTYNPYLDIKRIFSRNYEADNAGHTQDNQEHKKEHHDPSTCRVGRFKMIKYSFDADDEYVAIKEHECSEHLESNIDTCQTYKELFYIMDEGWLVTKACE